MKTRLVEVLTRKTVVAVQLLLATLVVLAVWLFKGMGGGAGLVSGQPTLFVQVSRTEFLLVLVLLFLNVAAAYAIFRQFQSLNRSVKWSTSLMIVSLLSLTAWLAHLFLFQGVAVVLPERVTAGVGRNELILALLLIFVNILAGVALYRRYHRVQSLVVISAYSKKVQYKGGWVTIEEYLARELGIQVSHGITPEEQKAAMEQFTRELAAEERPAGDGPFTEEIIESAPTARESTKG